MVANLPLDVEADAALKPFHKVGTIVGHTLEKKVAKKKVFFYVLFEDSSAVDAALKLDGKPFNVR
jgi:hypothetical protein